MFLPMQIIGSIFTKRTKIPMKPWGLLEICSASRSVWFIVGYIMQAFLIECESEGFFAAGSFNSCM